LFKDDIEHKIGNGSLGGGGEGNVNPEFGDL